MAVLSLCLYLPDAISVLSLAALHAIAGRFSWFDLQNSEGCLWLVVSEVRHRRFIYLKGRIER